MPKKEYLLRMSAEIHKTLRVETVKNNTTMMDFINAAIKEKMDRENIRVKG